MARTIRKSLDMSPGFVPPIIRVSQYDSDFTIVFTLYSSFGDFTLSPETTAEVRGTKRSGTGYSADAVVFYPDKTVTVNGDNQMTAVAGKNIYEIVLFRNSKQLSSANFILLCEPAALDANTIVDESVIKEFTHIEENVQAAKDAADRAEAAAESVGRPTDEQAQAAVNTWLDEHPEATTTVQDGAITEVKLSDELKLKTIKDYVTPEMFGANGDGITDDSLAFQNAISFGAKKCVCKGIYKIVTSITIENIEIEGGEFLFYDYARFALDNSCLNGCVFNFENLTRTKQTICNATGGKVIIRRCNFGEIIAEESAQQIYASDCDIIVDSNVFGKIRVNTINNVIGDEIGVARHVSANNANIIIKNNKFLMFDGTDDNYLEDSDAIHLKSCVNISYIIDNEFIGYAKSCVKVQFGKALIFGNHVNTIKARYCFRWHDSPETISICNNYIDGDVGIVFYTEDGEKSIVCENQVNVGCRNLVYMNKGHIIFNNNLCNIYDGISYATRPLYIYRLQSCKIESNSFVKSTGSHVPFFTMQNDSLEVNFSGYTKSQYSEPYSIYALSGVIKGLESVTINGASNLLIVDGNNVDLVNSSNVRGNIEANRYLTIRGCTDVNIEIKANVTTYVARLNTSQRIIIALFGTVTSNNIAAVEGGDVCTGVIINYSTDKTGIYDVAGTGVVYVAKTMLA